MNMRNSYQNVCLHNYNEYKKASFGLSISCLFEEQG